MVGSHQIRFIPKKILNKKRIASSSDNSRLNSRNVIRIRRGDVIERQFRNSLVKVKQRRCKLQFMRRCFIDACHTNKKLSIEVFLRCFLYDAIFFHRYNGVRLVTEKVLLIRTLACCCAILKMQLNIMFLYTCRRLTYD